MQYVLNYNSLQVWSVSTLQVRVFSLRSTSFILCRGCQNTALLKAVFFLWTQYTRALRKCLAFVHVRNEGFLIPFMLRHLTRFDLSNKP